MSVVSCTTCQAIALRNSVELTAHRTKVPAVLACTAVCDRATMLLGASPPVPSSQMDARCAGNCCYTRQPAFSSSWALLEPYLSS